jgi:hypothetical protein
MTNSVAEPGYTTTEFWGKLVVQLIGLIVLVGPAFGLHIGVNPNDPAVAAEAQYAGGLLAIVVPEIVYMISRGLRKMGTTSVPLTTTSTTTVTPIGSSTVTSSTASDTTRLAAGMPAPPPPATIPGAKTA